MRLVAISGSLRRQSINTCALRAASELAPAGVEVVFVSFADLPPFNPDDDTDAPPPAVVRLREEILHCDGVIIASPEYAHGVPGVLKNGLDWLVGSSEFVGKPVALLGTSQRAQFAPAALAEILRVMTADIIADASITLPLNGRPADLAALLADRDLAPRLEAAMADFVRAIAERRQAATALNLDRESSAE